MNPFSAVNAGWLGEARIEAGQPQRGREQILAALGGSGLPRVEAPYRPFFYDVPAGAEIALGRIDQADDWAHQARDTADGLGLPPHRGRASRTRTGRAGAGPPGRRRARRVRSVRAAGGRSSDRISPRARILAGRALAAATATAPQR